MIFQPFMYLRFLRFLILLFLCISMQGCTAMIWRNAFIDTVERPRIIGYTSEKSSGSGKPECLILMYQSKNHGLAPPFRIDYYYAIPLDSGRVPPLFDYQGSQRTVNGVLNDLSREKLTDISQYKFSKEFYKNGKSLIKYRKLDYEGHIYSRLFSDWEGKTNLDEKGISLIPYRWRDENAQPTGQSLPVWAKDGSFDPQADILILPNKQERFASERTKSILGYILVTPFYLLVDGLMALLAIITYPL